MADAFTFPFDRVTWRDGQRLTARDLADERRRGEWLRWLHTHVLHGSWGIVLGYEVVPVTGDPHSVLLKPGFGVDGPGRELILATALVLPAPAAPPGVQYFVLTASYQADGAFRDRPALAGLCVGGGLDPRQDRPAFAWRRLDEVRFGPEVPLARVRVNNGTVEAIDGGVRRMARRQIRPYVDWGVVELDEVQFKPVPAHAGVHSNAPVYVYADIDTSAAGFTRTPVYFAQFVPPDGSPAPADPATFIMQPRAKSFRFGVVWPARMAQPFFSTLGVSAARAALGFATMPRRILWVGFETVAGCPPVWDPSLIFWLSGFLWSSSGGVTHG